MQLFTVAPKQGALYLVMGNNAIGSTFATCYRISFLEVRGNGDGGRWCAEAPLFSNIICTMSAPSASK